jgi:NTE family protein
MVRSKGGENMSPKQVTIALQGGGTHLAFSWGVIDRLLEDGRINIEGASGTSAGGLTCAALGQGILKNGNQGARDELAAFWKMISEQGEKVGLVPSALDRTLTNGGIDFSTFQFIIRGLMAARASPYQWNPYGLQMFKKLLEDFFDFEALASHAEYKLFLSATNVRSGKLKIFQGEELTADAFMASACVPFLSQAVEVNGEIYWDGAYTGNPSLFPLIYNCESTDIIVILVIPHEIKGTPTSYDEISNRVQELFHTNTLTREMRSIEFVTGLIEQGIIDKSKMKKMNIHLIQDHEFFSGLASSSRANTDWDFLQMLYDRGRSVAGKWLKKNFDNIGVRSSVDVKETFV